MISSHSTGIENQRSLFIERHPIIRLHLEVIGVFGTRSGFGSIAARIAVSTAGKHPVIGHSIAVVIPTVADLDARLDRVTIITIGAVDATDPVRVPVSIFAAIAIWSRVGWGWGVVAEPTHTDQGGRAIGIHSTGLWPARGIVAATA